MGRIKLLVGFSSVMTAGFAYGQADHYFEKTLDNGFRIMVYENHELPQAYGAVTVNAGSKHDPANATGMAHYLEHLLFKGTNDLGTTNFEKEKPILDSITNMYDSLGKTKDPAKRLAMQLFINKLSIRAAQYAIPNEMDQMLSEIGSIAVNAYTTAENTVYYNIFPSQQLEKWMAIYAHRFEKPVFRLFQAELEIVYEEKNRGMDDLFTSLLETYSKEFYKKHPYGQQTTIGTTEHLKNPPLRKVYEYFYRYYIPNNMALVISGDVDHERVFELAETFFGKWERRPKPIFSVPIEDHFKGKEKIKTRKTPVPGGVVGFRTPHNGHEDNTALRISEYLLSNENGTGSIDKLVHNKKIMTGGIQPFTLNDYGGTYVYFFPRLVIAGLKNAEKRTLNCVEKLKKGDFTDDELYSARLNLVKNFQTAFESNRGIAEQMIFCFSTGIPWHEHMRYPEKLQSVSRTDVMRVSSVYFGKNCLAMYSRMGRLKKDKLAKPPYDPVKPPSGTHSDYYAEWKKIPETVQQPTFYKSETRVSVIPLNDSDTLYHVKSEINKLGRVDMRFRVGKLVIPALKFLPLYITEAESADVPYLSFRNKLDALGCVMKIEVYDNSTFVRIHGIDTNLDSAMRLCHAYLFTLSNNNKKFKKLLREDKRSARVERRQAVYYAQRLKEYALFGKDSQYLRDISHRQMKKQGIESLLKAFNTLTCHAVDVYYSGPDEAKNVARRFQQSFNPGEGKEINDAWPEVLNISNENIIYVYHIRKARQTHLAVYKRAGVYEANKLPQVLAFNRYYGGDMSSLVFQEVREFRSLAYTAYGKIELPKFVKEEMYVETYAACQADKTNETAKVLIHLVSEMPKKPEREETVKRGLREYCLSAVPDDRNKNIYAVSWKRRGFVDNPYEYVYHSTEKFKLDDLFNFYDQEIKKQPYAVMVVGNKKKLNMKELARLGRVVIVKSEDFIAR